MAVRFVDVTVLGLVGGAPAQGWGGDTARRRFIGRLVCRAAGQVRVSGLIFCSTYESRVWTERDVAWQASDESAAAKLTL